MANTIIHVAAYESTSVGGFDWSYTTDDIKAKHKENEEAVKEYMDKEYFKASLFNVTVNELMSKDEITDYIDSILLEAMDSAVIVAQTNIAKAA